MFTLSKKVWTRYPVVKPHSKENRAWLWEWRTTGWFLPYRCFSLHTMSCSKESPLLSVQMKEWPALLWLMCNYTFNTTFCPSCLFARVCVHDLKCHQALHSAIFGKKQQPSICAKFQSFRAWHCQTSAIKVNSWILDASLSTSTMLFSLSIQSFSKYNRARSYWD